MSDRRASRRSLLATGAAMTGGAVIGCATPVTAASQPKTPFDVPRTYIPVAGSDLMFPVRRIYCIGRNYAAHSREMGSDPTREPPFFFQKPTDAVQLVTPGTVADHPYPTLTKNYHYEVELVAAEPLVVDPCIRMRQLTHELPGHFNACYLVLLTWLERIYETENWNEDARRRHAIEQIATWPMMSMAIRPFLELSSYLPVQETMLFRTMTFSYMPSNIPIPWSLQRTGLVAVVCHS